jgi:hypothetical protein
MHVAVMTMVRNEGAMIPRWLAYYGEQVGSRNLFVLDDMSTDGSLDEAAATVIHLPVRATVGRTTEADAGGVADSGTGQFRKTAASNKFAVALLEFYDVVIFVDADEFIVPDPRRYEGLLDYLEHNRDAVVAPLGLNLVHIPEWEPALRPDQPLLRQRRYVKISSLMSKPAIKRVPSKWTGGTHGIAHEYRVRSDILLLHAKFADVDTLRRTHAQRHREYVATGAGGRSTWIMPPEKMEESISEWTRAPSPRKVRDFDPDQIDTSDYVRLTPKHDYRSGGQGVRESMRRQPFWRLPDYLTDQF